MNYDKMDGNRPKLSANRNSCYRLSRVSCVLAQISCSQLKVWWDTLKSLYCQLFTECNSENKCENPLTFGEDMDIKNVKLFVNTV